MAADRKTDSVLGLFLRLYWIMIGNAVLGIAATLPVAYPRLPVAPLHAGYALRVLALLAARYLDIRFCGGQTVDGTPADLGHFKRYVRVLIPVALLLPIVAWVLGLLFHQIGS